MKRENIDLIHCPTERMIADYCAKSLRGSLFKKMKDILMGITTLSDEKGVDITQNVNQVAPVESSGTNKTTSHRTE